MSRYERNFYGKLKQALVVSWCAFKDKRIFRKQNMKMEPAHRIVEIFKLGECTVGLEGALYPPGQHAPERSWDEVTVPL